MTVASSIAVAPRETMVDAVAQALIRYIAEHRLVGGDRLPSERALVEMTGASRLPLREALSLLKGLGIIEARHGKGIFVKQLDLAALFGMLSPLLRTQAAIDVRHLFLARVALETTIAQQAAEDHTTEQLTVLEQELAGMRAALRDRSTFARHDTSFHQELARASGNPVFCVFMASIMDLLVELQGRYRDSLAYRKLALIEHEKIVAAVRERDPAGARQAIATHLQKAMERLH